MSKRTNLDIKDTACLYIVHILQHPTSHPTTNSTKTTMVQTLKKNVSLFPAGIYGKSTRRSTQQRHKPTEGKSGLEAKRVGVLGALHSLRSKKKLAAENQREMHFLTNKEKDKWIEDYMESETATARI